MSPISSPIPIACDLKHFLLNSELEEVLKQYKVFLARKSSDKSQFLLQVPSTAAAAAPDDQHSQQQKQPLLPLILSLFEDLILSDPVAYSIKFPSEDSLWRVVYATISSYRIHLEVRLFPPFSPLRIHLSFSTEFIFSWRPCS